MLASLGLLATILVYLVAKKVYHMKNHVLLSPLLVTPVLLVFLLTVSGVPYDTYNAGAQWLTDMLQPATVAFAVPLYKYFEVLKRNAYTILASVFAGSLVAILSSAVLAELLKLNPELLYSLVPRSVTTPIAMGVSQVIGGVPTITAVFVIMTGICGIVFGPYIVRWFRIRNSIARGLLFGTAAHASGTSKAFEIGSLEGAVSTVAMILTALSTLFIAPWIAPLL